MGKYWQTGGYSSDVAIYLVVNGERLNVAQVGQSQLILRDRRDLRPGTEAEIIIEIDGVAERHPIVIPGGCSIEADVVDFVEAAMPF